MAQRQEAHGLVALIARNQGVVAAQGVGDGAVRVHRALGFAGGARGIDQNRQIAWPAGCGAALEFARVLLQVAAAEFAQGVQANDVGVIQPAQAFHVDHHDLAQERQALTHFQGLVELFVVFDKQQACGRVFAQVLHLAGRVGGVDAIGDTAAGQHGQVAQHPFNGGVGQDGRAFTRGETQRHQPARNFPHRIGGLVPGPALPDAHVLLAHPHLGPALGHRVPEHRGHGVARQHVFASRTNVVKVPKIRHCKLPESLHLDQGA